MAEAFLETTDWADITGCNHTYYLEGDKMIAYIRLGTSEPFWFKNPIRIDKRGRKFQKVDPGPFLKEIFVSEPELKDDNVVEVAGSKPGVMYYVNKSEGTCTCPGFTYRGTCKHVKELE